MNVTIQATMPTTGQFVMVNTFEGNIWANTMRHYDDVLEMLHGDMWLQVAEDFDSDIEVIGYIAVDESVAEAA